MTAHVHIMCLYIWITGGGKCASNEEKTMYNMYTMQVSRRKKKSLQIFYEVVNASIVFVTPLG